MATARKYLNLILLTSLLSYQSVQAIDIGAYSYADKAMPTLTVNGRQDEILLYPGQLFSAKVSLEAGDAVGQEANWWFVAVAGGAILHFANNTWQTGLAYAYQFPLTDITAPLLQNLALPAGEYDLFFAIDTDTTQPRNTFNPATLRFSQVHVTVPNSAQRVFYVSQQGNDDNPGSAAQPWKTLAKAAASAQAGDLVWVRGGTYKEQLVPQHSGLPNQPVVFAAYPGEQVILDGSGLNLSRNVPSGTPFDGVIHLHRLSHVWISGFSIKNSTDIGIMAYDSDNLVIQDNDITDSASSGIAVWNAMQVVIDGNEVNRANKSKDQENISIGENVQHFELRYNHVHHSATSGNGGEGIDIKDGSSNGRIHHNHVHDIPIKLCMYVDAWDTHSENLLIYNNRLHDCDPHGLAITAERGGSLKNIQVYNNLMYNNTITGVHVGAGYHPATDGIDIFNNSFYNNGVGNDFGASVVLKNRNAKNIRVFNNACDSTVAQISVLTDIANLSIKNNLFARKQDKWNGEQDGDNKKIGEW